MRSRVSGWSSLLFLALVFAALGTTDLSAQTSTGGLHGTVTDPSGAAVPQANITVTGAGQVANTVSNRDGIYDLGGLAPGKYAVKVAAKGFSDYQSSDVQVGAGPARKLDIPLTLEVLQEEVVVQDKAAKGPELDVTPSENASALVIKGEDLEALSDDPDELQSELEALAGPSTGPNGGQIYIDGFTGGQLPPKDSIREIRINQNPFSAEYDKLGYGRIEIFTKPGTDQYHGQFFFDDTDSALNSKDPLIPSTLQPSNQSQLYNLTVSGPLVTNKASFFFNAERRTIDNNSIVDANNTGNYGLAQQAIPNPQTRFNVTPRLDLQLGTSNTLTVRYQFTQDTENNDGIGQLSLASQGYNESDTEQTLQISDTQVVSPRTINETRFQYIRDRDDQNPLDFSPTVNVLGSFIGGGSSQGYAQTHQDRFELQNYTSMALNKHTVKFGARLRDVRDANSSNSGFNGTYTFSTVNDFLANTPSQFSIVTGSPNVNLSMFDAGLFVQDDWRFRPNITLSGGLRFETQTDISDHADLAPRLGLSWGLDGHGKRPPKTVLRAGFGIFYDRFADNLLLQAKQLNGINQQEYLVNCDQQQANVCANFYPNIPSTSVLQGLGSPVKTQYQVDPSLHAPYTVQSAVSLERQVTKRATVSVTYLNSRGFDQLILRNLNAPLPGTYGSSGVGPLGDVGNIYQYASLGIFRQNQVITNFRVAVGSRLTLFGFYSLNYANGDLGAAVGLTPTNTNTFGTTASPSPNFVSNSYNPMADYGRAAFDIRNRVVVGGSISLPHAFMLNPFIVATSGTPYNIYVGQDLNGDGIFNDRPSFANAQTPSADVVSTPLGNFNVDPGPGDTPIPINYGTGPGSVTVNLRLSKTIGFGKTGETTAGIPGGPHGGGHGGHGGGPGGGLGPGGLSGGGGHPPISGGSSVNNRYALTFSISARNLLNRENLAPPIGDLSSPNFGQSVAIAGGPFGTTSSNRRVDMRVLFTF